jgi:hypothetical protein
MKKGEKLPTLDPLVVPGWLRLWRPLAVSPLLLLQAAEMQITQGRQQRSSSFSEH